MRLPPSPFVDASRIHFVVGRGVTAEEMSLGIFDSADRLIRPILEEAPTPGTSVVRWDGRDSEGLRVGPGTYFCRPKAGDSLDALRLVELR